MNISSNTELAMNIGTIIGLVGFAIYWSVKFTSAKDKIENRIDNLEVKSDSNRVDVCKLKEEYNDNALVVMEIKTKLANIERMLLELKNRK